LPTKTTEAGDLGFIRIMPRKCAVKEKRKPRIGAELLAEVFVRQKPQPRVA